MRSILLLISVLLVCSASEALSDNKPKRKEIKQYTYNEKAAREIAERYFLKKTDNRIKKYNISKVSPLPGEEDYWVFFIDGEEEFARLGYQWVVKINKYTGKPEIDEGE